MARRPFLMNTPVQMPHAAPKESSYREKMDSGGGASAGTCGVARRAERGIRVAKGEVSGPVGDLYRAQQRTTYIHTAPRGTGSRPQTPAIPQSPPRCPARRSLPFSPTLLLLLPGALRRGQRPTSRRAGRGGRRGGAGGMRGAGRLGGRRWAWLRESGRGARAGWRGGGRTWWMGLWCGCCWPCRE